MPRRSRIVLPGVPHHITQRGNYRHRTFFDDDDREFYLERLHYYSCLNGLKIAAYCLMDNHTHLSVIPESNDSLRLTFSPLHMTYSQHLNKKFKRNGINWQGRFFSSPMDEEYTWITFQYIALNPVRAGIISEPALYKWSSAASHLGLRTEKFLTADQKWLDMAYRAISEISNGVSDTNSLNKFDYIDNTLHANLPLGSEEFIGELENRIGRKLRFRLPGRPKKMI